MSKQARHSSRAVHGTIRRRLLVNAVVDPNEAATRLPDGLRPHVTELGTVVGCCLLEIDGIRPGRVPSIAGMTLRATAHRISAEWDGGSAEPIVGVYVPVRHSDSRMAAALGGRWVPGVHERAELEIEDRAGMLRWSSDPFRRSGEFAIHVEVSLPDDDAAPVCGSVGEACLAPSVGLSPDRKGALEGARMAPDHRMARRVAIEELDSAFFSGFATAQASPSYLMTDVGVTWSRAPAPEVGDRVLTA